MTSTPSRGDLSWLSQTLSWCCRLACPHSTIFLPNSESVPEKAAFSPALGSGDAAKHCTLGHVIFFFIRVPPQTQLALACTLWEGTPPSPLLTGSSNLEKWFSLRPPQLAQWKEGTHFLTQTPHLVQGHKYRDPFPVSPASALPTAQRERVGVRDGQFCAVSPWKLSRDTGNQARLVFSSRNLVPVPGQAKRAAATVCRRRKCCCLGVGVGSGGDTQWGILRKHGGSWSPWVSWSAWAWEVVSTGKRLVPKGVKFNLLFRLEPHHEYLRVSPVFFLYPCTRSGLSCRRLRELSFPDEDGAAGEADFWAKGPSSAGRENGPKGGGSTNPPPLTLRIRDCPERV